MKKKGKKDYFLPELFSSSAVVPPASLRRFRGPLMLASKQPADHSVLNGYVDSHFPRQEARTCRIRFYSSTKTKTGCRLQRWPGQCGGHDRPGHISFLGQLLFGATMVPQWQDKTDPLLEGPTSSAAPHQAH